MFPAVSAAFNRLGIRRTMSPPNDDSQPNEDKQETTGSQEPYYPEVYDVLKVRFMLRWKLVPEGLPVEIVDMIMDAAEYWASAEVRMDSRRVIHQDGDEVLVRTWPLCYDPETIGTPSPKLLPHRTIHPCRKIVFSISSHDQGGWRRPRPYDGSSTWFDTEVVHSAHLPDHAVETQGVPPRGPDGPRLRSGHPLLNPGPHKLQSNGADPTASQQPDRHVVVWHYLDNIPADSPEAEDIQQRQGRGRATLDGSQVRSLELGDSISVWGRARYMGWLNIVKELTVRVFWAI
ncbi:hypothetical protein ATEIFO6365_0003005800 [Aspergillus terreus]|uniref:Uncharacterized protein n=1 Tax=Aspergillus terreus TaxID=33178 RepID=A0A5M3YL98_ASPTE|nr:hypothetical protein ATETN484_0001019500 [Aspergillus terreus]GFF14005.1 hypothetical protein ATEIFO6365_0003005800 [Aspergillus terreus]